MTDTSISSIPFDWKTAATIAAAAAGVVAVGGALILSKKIEKKRCDGIEITALNVYPVKSCRGMRVTQWPLDGRGLLWDRSWMLVEQETNKFCTIRQYPMMHFLETHVDLKNGDLRISVAKDLFEVAALSPHVRAQAIREHPLLQKPLVISHEQWQQQQLQKRTVSLWSSKYVAIDMGEEAAAWLSAFLSLTTRSERQVQVRLVMSPTDLNRTLNSDNMQYIQAAETRTAAIANAADSAQMQFQDEYQVLLAQSSSIDYLNQKLTERLGREPDNVERFTMERFRPNVVIAAAQGTPRLSPFVEDTFQEMTISSANGESLLCYNAKPCMRCMIPSINPTTGTRQEIVQTVLRAERMGKKPLDSTLFGANILYDGKSTFTVRVGDKIHVQKFQAAPVLDRGASD